jgi:hypothetical protein
MVVGLQRKSGLRTALASVSTVWCGQRGQPSDHCHFHLRQLRDQAAVVGPSSALRRARTWVGIDRCGGLEVSYLLGVPRPLRQVGTTWAMMYSRKGKGVDDHGPVGQVLAYIWIGG